MATRTCGMIHEDENLNAHFRATSIGKDTNVAKAKKATTGLGARKPLANITHSGRVNSLNKGLGSGGGRKALSDISNKKDFRQESKKSFPKKLNDIAEEQCLHNHHECIKSQKSGMDKKFLLKTLGFDDDLSMQLATPCLVSASRPPKVDSSTPLWHLDYEEAPEMLNEDWFPTRCQTPKHPIASPFQNRYVSSPTLMLLGSP